MESETYEIELVHADAAGTRRRAYHQSEGWLMDRLDNGVVILSNSTTRQLLEYSPYAWQSVRTTNINMEDTND